MQAMIPVVSSQISAMGHDPIHSSMKVAFSRGGVYSYQNVSKAVFDSVITADSVGKAFASTIKANPTLYPFSKVA